MNKATIFIIIISVLLVLSLVYYLIQLSKKRQETKIKEQQLAYISGWDIPKSGLGALFSNVKNLL